MLEANGGLFQQQILLLKKPTDLLAFRVPYSSPTPRRSLVDITRGRPTSRRLGTAVQLDTNETKDIRKYVDLEMEDMGEIWHLLREKKGTTVSSAPPTRFFFIRPRSKPLPRPTSYSPPSSSR